MVSFAGFTVMVGTGLGLIIMVTVLVSLHPCPLEPITVYVVFTEGVAIGLGHILQLSPVAGVQVYVDAPLALRVTLLPAQRESEGGTTEIVGTGLTTTVIVAEPVQPLESTPKTV
jgi:hypothetical protein